MRASLDFGERLVLDFLIPVVVRTIQPWRVRLPHPCGNHRDEGSTARDKVVHADRSLGRFPSALDPHRL